LAAMKQLRASPGTNCRLYFSKAVTCSPLQSWRKCLESRDRGQNHLVRILNGLPRPQSKRNRKMTNEWVFVIDYNSLFRWKISVCDSCTKYLTVRHELTAKLYRLRLCIFCRSRNDLASSHPLRWTPQASL
jgi:hypothetical protein